MNQPMSQSKATQAFSNQPTRTVPDAASAGTPRPTHAEIAERAYEIYLKKGRQQGQCDRNWLQAEQELRKQGTVVSQSKPSGAPRPVTPSYPPRAR